MALKTKTISDEVLQVLANLEINGQNVRILDNLNTKLYPKVKEALLSIGGKWQTKIKAHVFPEGSDPQSLIDGLLGSEKLPPKNPLSFFATSQPLALRMIALLAQYAPESLNGTLLDPEAGEGGIADEIPSTAKLILVELDQSRVEVLQKKGYHPIHADFLTLQVPSILVDGVLMNPPFTIDGKTTAYIDHIERASLWVKDGGAICAIAPSSFGFAANPKIKAFRDFVESVGEWHPLEHGLFKDSGTDVSAVMLAYRVHKPTEQSEEKMPKAIASGIFQTPAGDIAIQVFRGVDDALRFQFRGALIDPATYPHGEMIQWLSPIDLEDSDNFSEDETAITQYANFLAQENAYHFLMELDDLSAKLRQSLRKSLKKVSNHEETLGLIFNRFFDQGDAAAIAESTLERLKRDESHSEEFRMLALRLAAFDQLIDFGVEVACDRLWNLHLPDGQKDVSKIAAAVQVGAAIGKTTLNGQEGVLFSISSTMPSPNWSASGERIRAPQAIQGVLF